MSQTFESMILGNKCNVNLELGVEIITSLHPHGCSWSECVNTGPTSRVDINHRTHDCHNSTERTVWIGLSHKSHNAPVTYPTMHNLVTEICTCVHISVTKWCIVGYWSDAWDLWDGSMGSTFVQVIACHWFDSKPLHKVVLRYCQLDNYREILTETSSVKTSTKSRPFCSGLEVLIYSLWPSDAIWRHRSASILVQVTACCLTTPSHYLNQCWFIIGEVLWHLPQNHFTASAQATGLEMSLKITLLKLLSRLPRANELKRCSESSMGSNHDNCHIFSQGNKLHLNIRWFLWRSNLIPFTENVKIRIIFFR